ncbi:MAG: hypothetical protein M3Q23_17330 [Actinomycetota bacterium]|nr:hypothetical protein [Actinomycetota bacterium]
MYAREMATERITDMVRDADAYRASRATRAARSAERRARARRIAAMAVSLVAWPLRH